MELTDCAELDALDRRCLAPAVVTRLAPLPSTDGPVEHVRTRCLVGHVLVMPRSMLLDASPDVVATR